MKKRYMAGTIKVQVLKDEGFTRILKCSEGKSYLVSDLDYSVGYELY